MTPEVSVVIPTRNRRVLLERTVRSVLNQRDVSLELVIVDEASSDDTQAYVSGLGPDCVRALRNEEPQGVSLARNRGIQAAAGDVIAFLDDDDLWAPTKLRQQLDAMRRTGATWSYGSAALVDESLDPLMVLRASKEPDFRRRILESYLVPAGSSNVIVSADTLRSVGGFDPAFRHNADWDMWIRLGQSGPPAVVEAIVLAYVRHRQMVSTDPAGKYEDLQLLVTKHAESRTAVGARSSEVESLRWIGYSSLVAGDRRSAAAAYRAAGKLDRSRRDTLRSWLTRVPGYLRTFDALQSRRLVAADHRQLAWLASAGGDVT